MIPQSLRHTFVIPTVIIASWTAGLEAQSRTWMDAEGQGPLGQRTTGNTVITMDPGTSRVIEVWLQDGDPGGTVLASYQLIFQCTSQLQAGVTGSIDYVDNNPGMGGGDSIRIDTTRSDWVFAGSIANTVPVYNETCGTQNIFGTIYNTAIPLDDQDTFSAFPDGAYLAEFTIEASADACGTHIYAWNIIDNGGVPPLAALFAPGGAEWMGGDQSTEFQNLEIRIGPENDDCADAIVLDGSPINEAYDTTCAMADGPQTCSTGADLWYEYTSECTVLDGLIVTATSGDVVVYVDETCPPTGPGQCNPGPPFRSRGHSTADPGHRRQHERHIVH